MGALTEIFSEPVQVNGILIDTIAPELSGETAQPINWIVPNDGQKDFNEEQHPRDEGGRFASGSGGGAAGEGSITVSSPATIAPEYKEGVHQDLKDNPKLPLKDRATIAEVRAEQIVQEAIENGEEVSIGASSWEDVPSDDAGEAENEWVNDNYTEYESTYYNDWKEEQEKEKESYAEEYANSDEDGAMQWFKDKLEGQGFTEDSIENAMLGFNYNSIEINESSLEWEDPSEHEGKTAEDAYREQFGNTLQGEWKEQYEAMVDSGKELWDGEHENDDPPESITDNAIQDAQSAWNDMSDDDKFEASGIDHSESGALEEPDTYEPTDDGAGDDYGKTKAIARFLQAKISEEEFKSRGLGEIDADELAVKLWSDWKGSSTSGNGLLLQLATAKELGGHSRFTTKQLESATDAAEALSRKNGGNLAWRKLTDEERAKHDPMEWQQKRGLEIAKAHVHATWAASQHILKKAGLEDIDTYRGVLFEKADLDRHKQEDVAVGGFDHGRNFKKLPDIMILRNGAASTATKISVPNNWGGVGVNKAMKNPTRVVMRINAPREAVLSLPVFGQNEIHEQELVLAGTNNWNAWDAWIGEAPPSHLLTIKSMRGTMRRKRK